MQATPSTTANPWCNSALRCGREPDPDAVAFTESERFAPEEAVGVTRSHSSAPLILFRETHSNFAESVFDLVVPVLEPPEAWLNSVAELIARCGPSAPSSEALIRRSIVLRQETPVVRRQARAEREPVSARTLHAE